MARIKPDILEKKAAEVRRLIISMLKPLESHHIGCSMSIVELLIVLYFDILSINPKKIQDPARDIFILSKGHAAAVLYATLCLRGFFSRKILSSYEEDGGKLPGHVTNSVPGVEVSTGSLGHGLSIGVGFALSYIRDKKKNKVFVLLSDGELNEGSTWEAIMFAGHHRLNNLVAIVDQNGKQGYGKTKDVINLSPLSKKVSNFGWDVLDIDGHNITEVQKSLSYRIRSRPLFVFANTIKGKGIPFFEGKFESHYKSLSRDEINNLIKSYKSL